LVCAHTTRLTRRGRTPYPWFGLLWPRTSVATQFRARSASARGPFGMWNCWGDARHWFAPTPPACRVGDARRTRGLDFYGHILLWPPNSAHGPPVHAARLGCGIVGGTPDIGFHTHQPLDASGTHAVPVVWTSMATYFYGHLIPRTDRQCTRPGRDAELLGGRPRLVCAHTTRLTRRGRTPYPWFGLLWPRTSVATQFRARSASARGPFGMWNCWGDARHWFAPTPLACGVGDARRTRGLDFYGHILLWPPNSAHGPPVHAAR